VGDDAELPERWTAVVNPAAGRGRGPLTLPAVADALAAVDRDVQIRVSADLADAITVATAALDDGRGVVACGGDGTVCSLAGLAAERDGVLAIVPSGSGNDLARHLAVPRRDASAAAELLTTGLVTRVDLGRADAEDGSTAWFTTVANAGFDAEANRWANGVERIGGTPLYVLAVLRTLSSYVPRRVRVIVDDDVVDTDAWLVAVANTRSYAGGMVIAPGASLDDGTLDACIVGPVSRADFLRTFPKVFSGTHVEHPAVTIRRGRSVRIEMPDATDAPELWASGERVGPLPGTLRAAPGALRVVTPSTPAAAPQCAT
jgi:diacylglycerol kinase (ATP)